MDSTWNGSMNNCLFIVKWLHTVAVNNNFNISSLYDGRYTV